MLRELDEDSIEIYKKELGVLRFITRNKKYILNKLKDKKLLYNLSFDSDDIYDMDIKSRTIDFYNDKINIYELMMLGLSLDFNYFYADDNQIDYFKYLNNKFGVDIDTVLYDENKQKFYNDDEVFSYEIVFASEKIDKFLTKYNKKTDEYKVFCKYIEEVCYIILNYNWPTTDIRDKTNRFFYHESFQGQYKYNVCCFLTLSDYATDNMYFSFCNIVDFEEFLNSIKDFQIFIEECLKGGL